MKPTTLFLLAAPAIASAFVPSNANTASLPPVALQMGLFDGVKEAFGADGMGELDGDRETPIDRWMGWNAKKGDGSSLTVGSKAPQDFIDSMDPKNYVTASLPKPMGIVFEENDSNLGGIFVLEVNSGSSAEQDGTVKPGDQLVAVGGKKVSGLQFEDALGTIIENEDEKVKLVLFRGPAKFLYGPAGASQDWLDEFVAGGEKAKA